MGSSGGPMYGGSLDDVIGHLGPAGTPSYVRNSGSLEDVIGQYGSHGTPSLGGRSSPMVTSSSTISTSRGDADNIIAPPDNFSNGLLNLSGGEFFIVVCSRGSKEASMNVCDLSCNGFAATS